MGIWSRKSMHTLIEEAYGEGGPRLKRQLGIVGLTTFGVGCTIGAGIFPSQAKWPRMRRGLPLLWPS
jgi:hypothetical protein